MINKEKLTRLLREQYHWLLVALILAFVSYWTYFVYQNVYFLLNDEATEIQNKNKINSPILDQVWQRQQAKQQCFLSINRNIFE